MRVATAGLIFSSAYVSGVLTTHSSRTLPKVIVSLLEMGAPIPLPAEAHTKQQRKLNLHSTCERPITMDLVERLMRWLVPVSERAAAVGLGRRQILLVALFLLIMTVYAALYECSLGNSTCPLPRSLPVPPFLSFTGIGAC